MSRTILVTGGAGYIGSHTCKALARAGYEPITYDNLSRGHAWAVKWGPFEREDLGDRAALTRVLRRWQPEAVIHFAGFAYVNESMTDPGLYFRNNVTNSINLLDTMIDYGVKRIVVSSTCATYGMAETIPITEAHPQRPLNPYGESKLFLERVLRWYGECRGLEWVALRYFNAAGADPEGEIGEAHQPETHLVPLAIEAATGIRPCFNVFGTDYDTRDGTAIRDLIHVSDLSDAHVRALHHLGGGGASGTFNVGTGIGHSVGEIVTMLDSFAGRPIHKIASPRRPGDPPILVADPRRAMEVLGWQPKLSDLETILTTAWNWHASSIARRAA
jgi:UDP-arabinose 4-epimerase